METTTLAHGRVPRLLLQVLFVLAGAVFATLLSWCVATLTASAGTLPAINTPTVSTTDTTVALPITGALPTTTLPAPNLPTGLVANTADTADAATRTATGSLASATVTGPMTAALPTGLPRLTLLSGVPDLRTVTGSLTTVDTTASGVELSAQPARPLRAMPASADMAAAAGSAVSELPGPATASAATGMLAASVQRPGGGHATTGFGRAATRPAILDLVGAVRPATPDAPSCPDWQCALASVGAGSAGSAGLSRSGDLLSRFAFGDPRRTALSSLGVRSGPGAHVTVATGRQPGVTPD